MILKIIWKRFDVFLKFESVLEDVFKTLVRCLVDALKSLADFRKTLGGFAWKNSGGV